MIQGWFLSLHLQGHRALDQLPSREVGWCQELCDPKPWSQLRRRDRSCQPNSPAHPVAFLTAKCRFGKILNCQLGVIPPLSSTRGKALGMGPDLPKSPQRRNSGWEGGGEKRPG